MERFDVSEDPRLSDVVAAVERGEEVVIVRDGTVVAEVKATAPADRAAVDLPGKGKFDMAVLEELHRQFPIRLIGMSADIRAMRDADDR